jgi:hypothetical protein
MIRGSSAQPDDGLAPPDQPERHVPGEGRLPHRADLLLPVGVAGNLIDGRDLNLDGDAVEIPTKAYAVDTFDANAATNSQTTFKEIGNCETVNCGRGMSQTQTNVRVSKSFNLGSKARVEAIAEIFNLFNNINPSGFRARVIVPSSGAPDATLLQPATYSGDFRRPEQRIGSWGSGLF